MTGAIDLDSIVAIDVHVHAMRPDTPGVENEVSRRTREDQARRWKSDLVNITLDQTADYYRERRMLAVVFPVDTERHMGDSRVPNLDVAAAARRHPDVMIPFASIDPRRPDAIREARDLIENHGVKGFKFHPSIQGFATDEPAAYELYEVLAGYGSIALFHSGQTGIGRTSPGGGGVRLKHSNPMLLDDIAVDFPELRLIIAHPSFPWQAEALAVARHKQNVFIDLSGWSPKYFEEQLVQHANSLISDKVLFGSDFPVLTPDRWLADAETRGFKSEVLPKILKSNAARLLGLAED
ncbi:amidohydrolase family protein [Microbacterium sp.]|uniref:amidohydrolase family protein n=1 Tax=Microbacterium sp. TaxID=51671 RepID=UPI002BB3C75A|nr:amidohydrolase family protein [Microbacterium sp.]HWL76525.1 amidohydrolase family protein [Microbacterium sp.]HWV58648.1 amidohydrolase family protein [Longimicrobiales bacterium]